MNANDFDKHILSYLDGDLRQSDRHTFEELLKNNPECKEKFDSYQIMLKELSNLESLKTSDNFLDTLHNKIDKLPQSETKQTTKRFNLFNQLGFQTNEQIREWLLESAGVAIVPFQAFGLEEESGWFRISVGAVSVDDIIASMNRLESALMNAFGHESRA